MAQIFNPVSTACFLWKTEQPYREVPRKSCEFTFLDAKWWLETKYRVDNKKEFQYEISLKKKPSTVSKRDNISITTTLVSNCYNDNDGSLACYSYNIQVQTNDEINLWTLSKKKLTDRFFTFGVWKIICVFHDTLPSELQIQNLNEDSSTQTDANLTTVEKCTLVSQDFSDMEKLSEDLSNLFRLLLHPDAKLKCGNRLVPVHRSVLATRSELLHPIFQDVSTDTFDVDLNDEALDVILECAYSGAIRDLFDSAAISLHGAGKKYSVDSLMKACSDWMIKHMTEQNCVNFLNAANATDDSLLVQAVGSFLCDHPDVFKSEIWDRFAEQHASLAYKLIHRYHFAVLKHQ